MIHCEAWIRYLTFGEKPDGSEPGASSSRVGVSAGAVSPWMTPARDGGPEALRPRPHLMRRPRYAETVSMGWCM
jgi:hypothetical protein